MGHWLDLFVQHKEHGRIGLKCGYLKNNKIYARDLTPLECCRLMGYNDNDYNLLKKEELSDNAIKKICGNSIVVNVLENVFKNVAEEENND